MFRPSRVVEVPSELGPKVPQGDDPRSGLRSLVGLARQVLQRSAAVGPLSDRRSAPSRLVLPARSVGSSPPAAELSATVSWVVPSPLAAATPGRQRLFYNPAPANGTTFLGDAT